MSVRALLVVFIAFSGLSACGEDESGNDSPTQNQATSGTIANVISLCESHCERIHVECASGTPEDWFDADDWYGPGLSNDIDGCKSACQEVSNFSDFGESISDACIAHHEGSFECSAQLSCTEFWQYQDGNEDQDGNFLHCGEFEESAGCFADDESEEADLSTL